MCGPVSDDDQVQWAPFPTEPEEIKKAILVRQEAMSIMLAETSALTNHLKVAIGPLEVVRWMQEQGEKAERARRGKPQEQQEST